MSGQAMYRVTVRDLEASTSGDADDRSRSEDILATRGAIGPLMATVATPQDRWVEVSAEVVDLTTVPTFDIKEGIILVAGMMTRGEMEAEADDHDWLLGIEASPRCGWASTACNEEYLNHLKNEMILDLEQAEDVDARETLFVDRGWRTPAGVDARRPNRVIEAYAPPVRAGEPDGMIVIQALEMDEWRKERVPG